MAGGGLTVEARAELAASLGLEKFAELYPEAFDAAHAAARRMRAGIPAPEGIADEPAHVYRAKPEAEQ
jgi:hypothetical protein